jgi:hypothetical protein
MDDMAATRRELQRELEALQRQIDAARRENAKESPRATSELAQARKELQDYDTAMALARSASDVERGRITQAASNDPVITDTLQRLQQRLATAADTASRESGARQQGRQADAADMLAELGNLRRALDRAREQAMAQNESGSGDPSANSPDAQEGQQGQAGGQQGQQGQQGRGQQGQGGQQQAQNGQQRGNRQSQQGQGGQRGDAAGGRGDQEFAGNGSRQGGGFRANRETHLAGGAVVLSGTQRELLRDQMQMSAERLAQLRAQLASGVLDAADRDLLTRLESQLKRGGADPMSAEYQAMTQLVNQLELSALKSLQLTKDQSKSTHVDETVDDSRRYRDNVAEYYRRLGGGDE